MEESSIRKVIKQMNNSVIPSEQAEAMVRLLNFLMEPYTQTFAGCMFLELVGEKGAYAILHKSMVLRIELTGDIIHVTERKADGPMLRRVYGDFEKVYQYFRAFLIPVNAALLLEPDLAESLNPETKEVCLKDGSVIYFDEQCAEEFKKRVASQFDDLDALDDDDDEDDLY